MSRCAVNSVQVMLIGFLLLRGASNREVSSLKVAAILDHSDDSKSIAAMFRFAIDVVNDRLVAHNRLRFRLEPVLLQFAGNNPFKLGESVCDLLQSGVIALFGPTEPQLAQHVADLASAVHVPHIVWLPETGFSTKPASKLMTLNLFPTGVQLSTVYFDQFRHFGWKRIVVIHDNEWTLHRLQHIISMSNEEIELSFRFFGGNVSNMHAILRDVSSSDKRQIVADLSLRNTEILLKVALQRGMINKEYSYYLGNLDAQALEFEDYVYNHAHIKFYRLAGEDELMNIGIDLGNDIDTMRRLHDAMIVSGNRRTISAAAALLYDGVQLLGAALLDLAGAIDDELFTGVSEALCDEDGRVWSHGSTLFNYINAANTSKWNISLLTGRLKFSKAARTSLRVDVLEVGSEGPAKIGYWSAEDRFVVTYTPHESVERALPIIPMLRIVTLPDPPFVFEQFDEKGRPLAGKKRFTGYCIDLLDIIAMQLGFNYTIEIVEDRLTGAQDAQGNWNGMVRELIHDHADLAVGSLTITHKREAVIDFTEPFMNLGISILFQVPKTEQPHELSFLNPLGVDVWLYVLLATFIVTIMIYVVVRFSPYELPNTNQQAGSHMMAISLAATASSFAINSQSRGSLASTLLNYAKSKFHLADSLWFTGATLLRQGTDINPHAFSTRLISTVWFLFSLTVMSQYTANLAAFLTVERPLLRFDKVDDLAEQTSILYGVRRDGSTMSFFKDSNLPLYKKMWNFMEKHAAVALVNQSEDGIRLVKNGNFAFLMESPQIEYAMIQANNCDLIQVGALIDSKGYGFGLKRNSEWREKISMQILKLQSEGKLLELKSKWWRRVAVCKEEKKSPEVLTMKSVGGVFYTLLGGIFLSVLAAVAEFAVFWNAAKYKIKDPDERKKSVWTRMRDEALFAFNFLEVNRRLRPTMLRRPRRITFGGQSKFERIFGVKDKDDKNNTAPPPAQNATVQNVSDTSLVTMTRSSPSTPIRSELEMVSSST